jgi:hypothetical protein
VENWRFMQWLQNRAYTKPHIDQEHHRPSSRQESPHGAGFWLVVDFLALSSMKRKANGRNVGRGVSRSTKAAMAALAAPKIIDAPPILDLGSGLVEAVVVRRPSSRNKSPYVGDVRLPDGREAIAHMPSMDMGGKCASGVACVVRAATTKKGELVGADALGPHGTPKCEFILQLIRVEEPENEEMACGLELTPLLVSGSSSR